MTDSKARFPVPPNAGQQPPGPIECLSQKEDNLVWLGLIKKTGNLTGLSVLVFALNTFSFGMLSNPDRFN